ncbi:hypothetical protein AX15_002640 [Amanita polypyramis BW_CC]|nr:hypothetical protein AX15_002640 [Amanita polypyramis BW_CC]
MSSSLSKTLQFITSIKLQELTKQSQAFQAHIRVLEEARAASDPIARIEILHKAMRSWSGALSNDVIAGKLDLDNLELWLRQAKQDPSFQKDNLERWSNTLETHIRQTSMRFGCAKLFGNILQEWLSSGDSVVAGVSNQENKNGTESTDAGRKEKHEQMERFTSIVFEEKVVDTDALRAYLSNVFSGKRARLILEEARQRLKELCDVRDEKVTENDVKCAIDELTSGNGSLSDENIAALREFRQNDSVLTELASVLTMRLASIDTWSWPAEGIPIHMRRHLNGKYRVFTDPDIIDALLFHHLGALWKRELKTFFVEFFESKAWITLEKKMPVKEKERLEKQYDAKGVTGIEPRRHELFQETFLLSTLSDSMTSYDDSTDSTAKDDDTVVYPIEIKQKLLHLMATECQLNTKLHNKHAVVCSDFEWFGPSLPHASILTVLEFFGVTTKWLNFFKKWLAAPLRFTDGSDNGEVRVRKCGTPFNYTLSTLCGEAVLFVMDFAVNQASDGLRLYRLHDDLWLFDSDASRCARAWKEMNNYANLVGLTFNKEKTGSACVGTETSSDLGLPTGDVRWGLLKFDVGKGRFTIDQTQVDNHIEELRRQLNATKSIAGWVNAYNKYMVFLYRNFGDHPIKCFNEEHLDDLLNTFARIQSELFKDTKNTSTVGYLRGIIEKKFGVSDLPEGYFYFPITTGGLGLKNPFVELCSIWRPKKDEKEPKLPFDEQEEEDEDSYETYKNNWEKAHRKEPFVSYAEYLSHRGTWLPVWGTRYQTAMTPRAREDVNETPVIAGAIKSSNSEYWSRWSKLSVEDQWLVALYGEQLVDKFGGLDVVDADLIPLGMVELFKRSRIQLDQ